jgi:hypothetical protein
VRNDGCQILNRLQRALFLRGGFSSSGRAWGSSGWQSAARLSLGADHLSPLTASHDMKLNELLRGALRPSAKYAAIDRLAAPGGRSGLGRDVLAL